MPKLQRDSKFKSLYRNARTLIYYVRKYEKGKGELYKSTGEVDRFKAIAEANRILRLWSGRSRDIEERIFDEFAFECLDYYQSAAEKTFVSFELHLRRHLLPYFEGMPISECGKAWDNYRAHCKRFSHRSLKHDRKHLRFILGWAYKQRALDSVPELALDLEDRKSHPGREFSNEEYRKLKKAAGKRTRNGSLWQLRIDMGFLLGMRSSEIRKVHRDTWDARRKVLFLASRSVKTREPREVPVPDSIARKITAQFRKNGSPWLFPHALDKSRHATETDKTWQRIKRDAGVRGKFHWSRHTSATRAIRHGMPGPFVQAAYGMSDQVMKRIYLHASAKDRKAISRAVEKSFGNG